MKVWKIGVSITAGIVIVLIMMNIITGSENALHNINGVVLIDKSTFYEGITAIVLSIGVLCAVIIICTFNIIKALNNYNRMYKG